MRPVRHDDAAHFVRIADQEDQWHSGRPVLVQSAGKPEAGEQDGGAIVADRQAGTTTYGLHDRTPEAAHRAFVQQSIPSSCCRTGQPANYASPSPYLPGVTPITRLNMAMKALTLS